MRTYFQKSYISLVLILFLIWTFSCSGRTGEKKEPVIQPLPVVNEEVTSKLIKITSPEENAGSKLNHSVKVTMALEDKNSAPDSVTVHFNSNYVTTIKSDPWECLIPSVFTNTTGRKSLKVTAYKGGKPQNTVTRFMIIYSDIVPKIAVIKLFILILTTGMHSPRDFFMTTGYYTKVQERALHL